MKLTLITFLIFVIKMATASECIKNKAAFDIGSGTTKLKVAKIDICKSKILKVLHESNIKVGYKQALKTSSDNKLSKSIINEGLLALLKLKKEAQKYKPVQITGVATSAFRTSLNGESVAKYLSSKSLINIQVISQKKEAILGFVGAVGNLNKKAEDIIVWDIGGGSMQLTSYGKDGKYQVYEGKLASVSFKNIVIEKVQKYNPKTISSPNPINKEVSTKSLILAKQYAQENVPDILRKKLLSPNIEVIGIGGVHFYSISKKISNNETYSLEDINTLLNKSLNKTDKEIGGEYAASDVTNLILVSGFMDNLKIPRVNTLKVNLADGALLMSEL